MARTDRVRRIPVLPFALRLFLVVPDHAAEKLTLFVSFTRRGLAYRGVDVIRTGKSTRRSCLMER
jgi:hypothetical protein